MYLRSGKIKESKEYVKRKYYFKDKKQIITMSEAGDDNIETVERKPTINITREEADEALRRIFEKFPELTVTAKKEEAAKPRNYKIDPNTPIFYGRPDQNVHDWFTIVEANMSLINVPDDLKINMIKGYVRGAAFQAVEAYQKAANEANKNNWETFKEVFKKKFEPFDFQNKLKIQLRQLRQTGSLSQYIMNFETLINQIDEMIIEDQILQFQLGLNNNEIRFQVRSAQPETLEEAIEVARLYDDCMHPQSSRDVAALAHINTIKHKRICTYRRGNNVRKFNFKNNTYQNNSQRKEFKPQREKTEFTKLPKRNKTDKKDIRCFKCNQFGHYASECNVKKGEQKDNIHHIVMVKTKHSEILHTYATLDGKEILVHFDSGATASCISVEAAKRLKFNILPCDIEYKTASNHVKQVEGITEPIRVDVHSHTCNIEFLVIEHEDHDVLLGLDWFTENSAGIFPGDNLLRFKEDNIYLGDESQHIDRIPHILTMQTMNDEDDEKNDFWDFNIQEIKSDEIINLNFMLT